MGSPADSLIKPGKEFCLIEAELVSEIHEEELLLTEWLTEVAASSTGALENQLKSPENIAINITRFLIS
jgi:hypothetical protein